MAYDDSIRVLTWNPKKYKYTEYIPWHVSAVDRISPGSRFIIVRTGSIKPGIITFGTITSMPYQAKDYEGRLSKVVDYKTIVPIVDTWQSVLISREELIKKFPGTDVRTWAPQQGGVSLSSVVNKEELFELLNALR